MRMILYSGLQGLLIFLGLGLILATKPAFLLLVAVAGLLLGAGIGMFLSRQVVPDLYLWIGPILSGLFAFFVVAALNILLEGAFSSRWVLAVSLLGTAPGLFVGWLLGQNSSRVHYSNPAPLVQGRAPAALRFPYQPQQLVGLDVPKDAMIIASEANALQQFGSVSVQQLDNQQTAIIVRMVQLSDQLTIYIVCSQTYPTTPPEVMAELHRSSVASGSPVQIVVRSPTLEHWPGRPSLVQVVGELISAV